MINLDVEGVVSAIRYSQYLRFLQFDRSDLYGWYFEFAENIGNQDYDAAVDLYLAGEAIAVIQEQLVCSRDKKWGEQYGCDR